MFYGSSSLKHMFRDPTTPCSKGLTFKAYPAQNESERRLSWRKYSEIELTWLDQTSTTSDNPYSLPYKNS